MSKKLLLLAAFLMTGLISFAQKGQVWPTESRQEFDLDANGNITKEYESQVYYSYYLFINNNEFIHCTNGITSLYKIIKRNENRDYVDYTVVSEVGNQYAMRFAEKEQYIVITNLDQGYSIYIGCYKPYVTAVFDNINR